MPTEQMSTLRRLRRLAECINAKTDEDMAETQVLILSLYITLLQKQLTNARFPSRGIDNAIIQELTDSLKRHLG